MALYIVRVELHDATWQHYVNLARDLTARGITDVIAADNGQSYKMSPAEYNYVGPEGIDAVLNAVKTAAAKTGLTYAAFVTEAARTKWTGLPVAQSQRRVS